MKKLALSLFALCIALTGSAAPRRVVLVVQNHCSGRVQPPLNALADTLTVRLSQRGLKVINPQNVIGAQQNRTSAGEPQLESSATDLARILNADGVVTASVTEFSCESIGIPQVAYSLKARIALSLADAASGATICGTDGVRMSKNYAVERVKADEVQLCESHLHTTAEKCADSFLQQYAKVADWTPGTTSAVHVNFTCNIQGADVKIDGVAMGTIPAMVSVPSGVHNLTVEYPFCVPYVTKACFTEGQTYNVVLQLNSVGRERFKSEKLFAETLDRIRKTGDTDDYVRKTLADGTSQYWKNSAVKIDKGEVKDLKLSPPGDGHGLENAPTVNELMEKAKRQ